ERFYADGDNALHSFCHADGRYHLMGCILSAAGCNTWWLEEILGARDYQTYNEEVERAGDGGVFFLPYLMGERSPHNDVDARGAVIGLSGSTTRGELGRAVMEGVAFALKSCLDAAEKSGAAPTETNLCGGGAKSAVWRQMIADVLNLPVHTLKTEQGPAYGAVILAMTACGVYDSVHAAVAAVVKTDKTTLPDAKSVKTYRKKYEIFQKMYPALKEIFHEIKASSQA
ncbi:MAG: xylulokinase, partial [Clostridiales bacterium]|nr:xylulokinase [Clostridiales bacterium]